jgi:hypothetical protein
MFCMLEYVLLRLFLGYLEICTFYSGNYGRVDVLGLTLAEYHTYHYFLSVEYLYVVSNIYVSE